MVINKNIVHICTTTNEDKVFNDCYEIINGIMAQMVSYGSDEMQSTSTGEVITYDDFRRMLGILDGLPYMDIMYNSKR